MTLSTCVTQRLRVPSRAGSLGWCAGLVAAALGCGLDREGYYQELAAAGAGGTNGDAVRASGDAPESPPDGRTGSAGAGGSGSSSDTYLTLDVPLVSSGLDYSMLVARPRGVADDEPLPLVIAFHGDREASVFTAEDLREALRLEDEAAGVATFVYPRQRYAWPHYTDALRAEGVDLVMDLLAATEDHFALDRERVFLVGWNGGAYFVNAIACRLPAGVVRGLAVHSGRLHHVNTPAGGRDFAETSAGQTSCNFPSALLIWGTAEAASEYGLTRTYYSETLRCAPTTSPWAAAPPCVSYDACPQRQLVWCGIEGLGHSLWPGAGAAIWRFIDGLR